jgi:hypothetical protein
MADRFIEISMKLTVTDGDIDDIMCTALEGGVNYWADDCEVVNGEYLGKWAHEHLSKGDTLRFHVMEPFDDDDTEYYDLDEEKFIKGLKMYLQDPDKPYEIVSMDLEDGYYKLDPGMVDADVADMIVQYALFGEIIYG